MDDIDPTAAETRSSQCGGECIVQYAYEYASEQFATECRIKELRMMREKIETLSAVSHITYYDVHSV